MLSLLRDAYLKADARVLLNHVTTKAFMCNKRVRQGCPLSPILFTADLKQELQSALNTLYMYCEKWALKCNMKILVFDHALRANSTVWYHNDNPLE